MQTYPTTALPVEGLQEPALLEEERAIPAALGLLEKTICFAEDELTHLQSRLSSVLAMSFESGTEVLLEAAQSDVAMQIGRCTQRVRSLVALLQHLNGHVEL